MVECGEEFALGYIPKILLTSTRHDDERLTRLLLRGGRSVSDGLRWALVV